jgi:phage terminase large subunit
MQAMLAPPPEARLRKREARRKGVTPTAPTRETLYVLRPHQQQLYDARARFSAWVAHRRFGKTFLSLYCLLHDALHCQASYPRFAYVAPLRNQAKTIVWDVLKRYTQDWPGVNINEAELRVDLARGSRIQLFGADNPDALRGMYLDGVVFDEYAQMRPRTWTEVVRPALADRQGWAVFISTPLGHNHFYDLYQDAQHLEGWHTALYRADETGIVDAAELEAARQVMSPEQYNQEFLCSFESALIGAYYAAYLETAREEQRITRVPWQPNVPVHTAWDLGISDATAIWFVQPVGRMLHVIDYLEASDHGLEWYAKVLRDKPYTYGRHYFPHDIEARDFSSDGRTRLAMAEQLGLKPAVVVPRGDVADGIQAVRTLFPRFVFDQEHTYEGVECLKAYRREWSETRKAWLEHPLHDFASHAADALRTFAQGYQEQDTIPVQSPTRLAGTMPTGLRQGFWFR